MTLESSAGGGVASEWQFQIFQGKCGLERVHQGTGHLGAAGSALKKPRGESAKKGRRTDFDFENKMNDLRNIAPAPKRKRQETLEDLAVLDPVSYVASPAKVRLDSPVVTPHAAIENSHVRDRYIKFEEEPHRYILHPGTDMEAVFPISVSGLWARFSLSSIRML